MRKALLAAVVGGVLPFAFAPYGCYPIAALPLAVLFWLWRDCSPARAAAYGGCFGFGLFAHGASWVQVSIHQFGLPLYTFSVSMTLLFIVILAVFPALAGYVMQRTRANSATLQLLIGIPCWWVASEYLRSWAFSGFPWLLLGYSQTDSWLAGYAPIVGAYGISLVVAFIAALLVFLSDARNTRASRLVAIGTIVLAISGGGALRKVDWTVRQVPPIKVALVQGAVPQTIKWQPEYRAATLALYDALTTPQWGNELVVWPETAIPAFPDEIRRELDQFGARARNSGTALLVGIPTGDRLHGPYFNSVVLLNDGVQKYDKHHLVPAGEYLPLDQWIRPILNFLAIPMSNFSPGKPLQAPLEYGAIRAGVSICYEDAYAEEVAKPLPAANILVNVSDDAWFGDSIAPHQHLQIARMRALEGGRYLLRATNTGISAIIDPRGQVIAQSPQFESYVLTGSAELREGATPFIGGGRYAVPLLLAAGIFVGGLSRYRVIRTA
jgi:apolipoprotein N-acyltransferase